MAAFSLAGPTNMTQHPSATGECLLGIQTASSMQKVRTHRATLHLNKLIITSFSPCFGGLGVLIGIGLFSIWIYFKDTVYRLIPLVNQCIVRKTFRMKSSIVCTMVVIFKEIFNVWYISLKENMKDNYDHGCAVSWISTFQKFCHVTSYIPYIMRG